MDQEIIGLNWFAQPGLAAYLILALFGLCIGSFLNVVIFRLPLDLSIVKPRSACPSCKNPIAWYDNVPVFSYVFLAGKCRHCQKRISFRYPLIELVTAGMFVFTLYFSHGQGLDVFLVRLILVSCFIAITMIDFDHFIIPDEFTISGMFVAPVCSYLVPALHYGSFLAKASLGSQMPDGENAVFASLLGIAAGSASVYLVGLGGKLLFKKDAMGFGDVKFMGAVGGFLGAESILTAFFVGAVFGSAFGILNVLWLGILRARKLRKRGYAFAKALAVGMKLGRRLGSYIPFGPFLALGCTVLLFFRSDVFHFVSVTWFEWIRSWIG